MIHNLFGWDYPAGAEHDPDAPWNARDPEECPMCHGTDTHAHPICADEYECESCMYSWGPPEPEPVDELP